MLQRLKNLAGEKRLRNFRGCGLFCIYAVAEEKIFIWFRIGKLVAGGLPMV
jgi:hypothetical protein